MKKQKRITALILAAIMLFTAVPLSASAATTTVNVSSVDELQSPHNYTKDMDKTWVYTHSTDADSLEITFSSDTQTESNYDYIYILDGNDVQIGRYSGTSLSGTTITVPGNVVKVRLKTDDSGQYYGFRVTKIKANSTTVVQSGKCGANVIWNLYSNGLLTLEGSGATYDYTSSSRPTFYTYSSQINEVVIDNGITKIGEYLFYNKYYGTDTLYSITTVYIPDSVTTIGDYSFYSCRATDIYLGSGISSIGSYVFNNPYAFKIHYNGSPAMKQKIYFEISNGTKYATWNYLFDGGSFGNGLTWNYNIESKKLIVSGNGAIPSYSISTYEGKVSPWYQYKENIEEVIIGNGITDIGTYAFYSLPNLKKLTLSDSIESIKYTNYSIHDCPNITYIYLGKNLKSLPTHLLSSVSQIEISPENSTFCSKDNVVFSKDMKRMQYYPASKSDKIYYVPIETEIIDNCFNNNTNLDAIYLHPYVEVDSGTFHFMDRYLTIYAFEGSPAYNTVNTTSYAYYYTSSTIYTRKLTLYSCGVYGSCGDVVGILSTVSYPEWQEKLPVNELIIRGTGYMENMSTYPWNSYMYSIKEIVVEDGVKSISNRAFAFCNNLEDIYIGNTVESIGSEAVMNSSKLTTLNIPDSVKTIGNYAFEWCKSLNEVIIGKGLESIGRRAFRYNMTREYVIDEDNPNFKAIDGHIYTKDGKKLVRYAIGNISSDYSIPNETTSIGFAAFEGAVNLKNIHIPLSVTNIESDAFYITNSNGGYYYFDNVYYEGCKSQWDRITGTSSGYSNNTLLGANIHFLGKTADYSVVDTVLAKIPADLSVYTDETAKAVTTAVTAVEYELPVDQQAVVNAYALAIEEAVAKLQLKPADYIAIETALAKVPADLTIYTTETAKAVTDAVNAVVYDLTIDKQETVDGYAKAIEDAVANLKIFGTIEVTDDLVNYRLRCMTEVVDGNLVLTADPAGTSSMKVRLGNLPEGATVAIVGTNANASMSSGIITVTNPGMKNVNVPMTITSAEGIVTEFVLVADFNNAIRYATYARLSQTGNSITVTSGAATAYVLFDTTEIDGGYVEVTDVSRNLLGRYVVSGSSVRFYNPVYDEGTVTVNVKNANGETVETYYVTVTFADATEYTAVLDTSLRCRYEVDGDNITVTAIVGATNVYLNFGRYYAETLTASVNDDLVKKMGARSWRIMRTETPVEFDVYFDATSYGAEKVTRHVTVNF